ncbi:ATP-binding cassette domain-containing protein [Parafilimonas terrae]|uniref:Molybdate transport system ATP-binding protein n=1 Tax=Parafilimonas terrae TaxID=1465490 RepID=A0A1I5U8A9_9BACT|nr:ATP-binding cassette domain-containing protein [Parafilimonas terrae]SFP91500.1 molybdate transport system ATP-binding protein [Parafilimonas terrae]
MAQTSIIVNNININQQQNPLLNNVSFNLNAGEHLLITGSSGSGKTILAKALAGKIFYKGTIEFNSKPEIIFVEQHYFFKTLSNTNDFYYQQRYNSSDNNDALTVSEELLKVSADKNKIDALLNQLQLNHRRNDALLHLSSGEHKRFQLIKAFLQDADVFIFDTPFIGLDINSRKVLKEVIDEKSKSSTIIIIADIEDAPACITHVAELENGKLKQFANIKTFKYSINNNQYSIFNGAIPKQHNNIEFDVAVRLENVSVAYGEKKILSNVNWQINRGERWLLKGVNGAGKSTLTSLITGDHPQAYSNKVFLFDKKRGSGESIWDIKRKIGFVSPELHWYYDKTVSVYNTIASGFFDTIGVYKKLSGEQKVIVEEWLQFLNIQAKAQQQLHTISTSQQRLTLLARALVKNPPLLILDEPCQGLDEQQVKDFVALVDDLCNQSNTTLIYVSHYENEIPKCVDKVMLLENNAHKQYSINIKKTTAVAV